MLASLRSVFLAGLVAVAWTSSVVVPYDANVESAQCHLHDNATVDT
jgi:hypothetical protein